MTDTRTIKERFRFSSTDTNALNQEIALREEQNGAHVERKALELDNGQEIRYFHIRKKYRKDDNEITKEICLFDVVKDSHSKKKNPSLAYCGDVIQKIAALYPQNNVTVLLPTLQCRGLLKPVANGWFKKIVQKSHIVLTELNLTDKKLIVHDSQSNFNPLLRKLAALLGVEIYPDNFLKIVKRLEEQQGQDYSYQTKFYNKQNDNISCGIFNHQYILSYFKHGDANQFQAITVQYGQRPSSQKETGNTIFLGVSGKKEYLANFLKESSTAKMLQALQTPIMWLNEDVSFDEMDLEDYLAEFEMVNETATETVNETACQNDSDLLEESFVKIGDPGLFSPKIQHEIKPPVNLQEALIVNYKP